MRAPELRLFDDEIIIDSFAGGGGASLGIEMATGRSPDIAINHDAEAIAMHQANHPKTRHFCESVWKVDPREAVKDPATGKPRKVGLAWFSPDCKHFSKAKGGKPVNKKIRGLAWVVVSWAERVRPRVICLENVEEFQTWGPLLADGRPDRKKLGRTFRAFVGRLKKLGYAVDWWELRACDFGAPTTRKRLFMVARNDGQPIVRPEPTHGPSDGGLFALKPHRTAAECIDFGIPSPSIFGRKKRLKPATEARIARGVWKYVVKAAKPFIVPLTHHGERNVLSVDEPFKTITGAHRGETALVAASLVQTGWGERDGQAPRCLNIEEPIGVIPAQGIKQAVVAAFLAKHNGGKHGATGQDLRGPIHTMTGQDQKALVATSLVKLKGTCKDGQPVTEPIHTIQAGGLHFGEVRAFLTKYYKTATGQDLREPLHTVTTDDRFALVTVEGELYAISDIGMRMLVPRELFNGQGFPRSYKIDIRFEKRNKKGKLLEVPLSKTAQVRMAGNSVCPPMAAAIVRAQFTAMSARASA